MSTYAHIKRCLELSDRDIASAVAERGTTKALLDQLAKVSRPGDGAPKLLLVFAKIASSEVDWIDGSLRIEMVGDADVTVVEVLSELGLGMHERVFPSFKMGVPLDEFARAVERVPHMVAPLVISSATNRRLVLTASTEEEEAGDSPAAPAVSISDESLYAGARRRASKAPGPRTYPRTPSSAKFRAVRRASKADLQAVKLRGTGKSLRPTPAAEEAPPKAPAPRAGPPPLPGSAGRIAAASPVPSPKITPAAALPKPPALPRTDERTPAPGPSPVMRKAIVAKVPLNRIQVPRGSRPPAAVEKPAALRPSKHP